MVDVGGVVSGVMPYLAAAAAAYGRMVVERVAKESADAATDATVGLGRRLLRRLLGPGTAGQEAIAAAVTDLGEHPDDEDFQHAVRAQLKKALAADAQLRSDLVGMLQAAGVSVAAVGERSVAVYTNTGVIATGDDVSIQR